MRRAPADQSRAARAAGQASKGSAALRGVEEKTASTMLDTAIKRLVEVIDLETAALRERRPIDLTICNNRKSQGLLELDRALKLLDGADPGEPIKQALRALREKLETNREVLATHLDAVREVATIIAEAIRNVESDGTYSVSFRSKGPEP